MEVEMNPSQSLTRIEKIVVRNTRSRRVDAAMFTAMIALLAIILYGWL
jgi:hypothetical protein